MTTDRPNLFDHARSELAQDAVLAWMAEWAHPARASRDPGLHELGRAFLAFLHEQHDRPVPEYDHVEVFTQAKRMDVVVNLKRKVELVSALLIEDKVYAGEHGDQLARYKKAMEETVAPELLLPIYLTTWFIHRIKDRSGYKILDLEHMAGFLGQERWNGLDNAIFQDFREHIVGRWQRAEAFKSLPMEEWTFSQWTGLFNSLKKNLPEEFYFEFDQVDNPSGGFIACWGGGTAITKESRPWIYFQIDVNKTGSVEPFQYTPELSLRVSDPKDVNGGTKALFALTMEHGRRAGWEVRRPKRLTTKGATARFAILEADLAGYAQQGTPALEHIQGILQRCHRLLKDIAQEVNPPTFIDTVRQIGDVALERTKK